MKNYIGHKDGQIVFATQTPSFYKFVPPDDMCITEVDDETYARISPTVGLLKFRGDGASFTQIPEKPSEFHTWDWTTHAWVQDRELAERSVRAKRAALLNATVDKINAVRWAAMSPTEQDRWDTYRTALLDIPDQVGFPFSVIWPVAPK